MQCFEMRVYQLMLAGKVYISARSAKECEKTASELSAQGPGTCVAIPADMQKLSEVERLVKELGAREEVLHVLVNNAGAAWGDPIDAYPVCRVHLIARAWLLTTETIGFRIHEAIDAEHASGVLFDPEMSSSAARGGRARGYFERPGVPRSCPYHQRTYTTHF